VRTGANSGILGDFNARLLLGAVRRRSIASRPELASELGLSLQAVTRIVAGLCRDGLLQSCGKKTLGVGQPTQFYQLVPDAVFSIGIQLQRTQLQLVVTDFCGQYPAPPAMPAQRLVAAACTTGTIATNPLAISAVICTAASAALWHWAGDALVCR